MRILSVGESPSINSGFANVLRALNQHWLDEGHEVAQLGWCFFPGQKHNYPYKIYPVNSPNGKDNYFGINKFDAVVMDFRPDIVFTLGDVYMLDWMPNTSTRNMFKWILYTPIDSIPIPRCWNETLTSADLVITYSQFGYDALVKYSDNYRQPVRMIYHGYNSDEFFVLDELSKRNTRYSNRLEDSFVFGYVGTNSLRKHPDLLLEAWSKFYPSHRDCTLLMHTAVINEVQGFDLREVLGRLEFGSSNIIFIERANPVNGVSIDQMNKFYNLIDIFVSSASCEGFGLPFLEAAACGTPSIAVDYSSMPELIGGRGELVKPLAYYTHRPLCQKRPLIDVDDFVYRMEKLYDNRELLADYGNKCIEFAKDFVWEKLFPSFDKALADTLEFDFHKESFEPKFVEV